MPTLREILERRAAIAAELRSTYDAAETAGRDLNEIEATRWQELTTEDRTLATNEERARQRAELDRTEDPAPTQEPPRELQPGEVRALRPEQRMAELETYSGAPLSLGRAIRAAILGDWSDAEAEQRVMGTVTGALGGFLVPSAISASVIDLARNQSSVIRAGAGTIPMPAQKLRVVRVISDPTAAWRAEGAVINESDAGFEPVELVAHSLAALVRVNLELLEDVPTFAGMIEGQLASALGLEVDRAALNGSGTAPEPRGVLNTSGIFTDDVGGPLANYDPMLDAIGKIEGANIAPAAALLPSGVKTDLSKLKTGISGDLTKLTPPAEWSALNRFVSNQVPADTVVIGDFSQMAVAMRSSLQIEASRTAGDAFSKAQVLVRAILRADVLVMRPKAFASLTGIEPAGP